MTANVNGVSYKVTKVENANNAQVSITKLDKRNINHNSRLHKQSKV